VDRKWFRQPNATKHHHEGYRSHEADQSVTDACNKLSRLLHDAIAYSVDDRFYNDTEWQRLVSLQARRMLNTLQKVTGLKESHQDL
jgi:hypothetical protein